MIKEEKPRSQICASNKKRQMSSFMLLPPQQLDEAFRLKVGKNVFLLRSMLWNLFSHFLLGWWHELSNSPQLPTVFVSGYLQVISISYPKLVPKRFTDTLWPHEFIRPHHEKCYWYTTISDIYTSLRSWRDCLRKVRAEEPRREWGEAVLRGQNCAATQANLYTEWPRLHRGQTFEAVFRFNS